jgi:hypothetical protein
VYINQVQIRQFFVCRRGLKYVAYGQFHKIPVSMTKLFHHAAAYRRHGKQVRLSRRGMTPNKYIYLESQYFTNSCRRKKAVPGDLSEEKNAETCILFTTQMYYIQIHRQFGLCLIIKTEIHRMDYLNMRRYSLCKWHLWNVWFRRLVSPLSYPAET